MNRLANLILPDPKMTENREQEALHAYLNLLKNKGANPQSLKEREQFLLQLLPALAEIPNEGAPFRDAVEDLLDGIAKSDWPFYLAVAREYYPFWTKDIKAIAALNAEAAFDPEPLKWHPLPCDLKTMWNTLDKEQFTVVENWPIKAYTLALRQEGATQALVDTRVKLVKLLLVRLKDAPDKNPRIYRIAVDATVPLFDLRQTRRLFLVVVREFFYFWIGDPDAANYILKETITDSV